MRQILVSNPKLNYVDPTNYTHLFLATQQCCHQQARLYGPSLLQPLLGLRTENYSCQHLLTSCALLDLYQTGQWHKMILAIVV